MTAVPLTSNYSLLAMKRSTFYYLERVFSCASGCTVRLAFGYLERAGASMLSLPRHLACGIVNRMLQPSTQRPR